MFPGLRLACLAAAVVLLVALPVGEATVLLALMLTLDLAAAAWALRLPAPAPRRVVAPIIKAFEVDEVSLQLLRRTVPAMRMRHPDGVVTVQVHWRKAAETRRARQEVFPGASAVWH